MLDMMSTNPAQCDTCLAGAGDHIAGTLARIEKLVDQESAMSPTLRHTGRPGATMFVENMDHCSGYAHAQAGPACIHMPSKQAQT